MTISATKYKSDELKQNGFITLQEYFLLYCLSQSEKREIRQIMKTDRSNFDRVSGIIFIKKDYVFISKSTKSQKGYYVSNVIDVLNVLIRLYDYLAEKISFKDGLAYIDNDVVIYNTTKQRAFIKDSIDVMFYLRDIIISKEGENLKYNNAVDFFSNHLTSIN
jgi:hypothetical protein